MTEISGEPQFIVITVSLLPLDRSLVYTVTPEHCSGVYRLYIYLPRPLALLYIPCLELQRWLVLISNERAAQTRMGQMRPLRHPWP